MSGSGAILTLDLATRIGFALWEPGSQNVTSGSYRLPKTGRDVGQFLVAFDNWFSPLVSLQPVSAVVFEAPWVGPQTNQDTARKLLGLAGMTEYLCKRSGITRCYEVNNASVRKHFIGSGRGKRDDLKARTITACRERGWNPDNDDEADALSVLDYAAHILKLEPTWACGALFNTNRAQGAVAR